MNTKDYFQALLEKAVDGIISVKFAILVIASAFLAIGKINQDNWVNIALFISGFKTIGTVAGIAKGLPAPGSIIRSKPSVTVKVDNPDA
jgi:uncharacterized membrane protein YqaE (UPF0057 family)